MDTISKKHRSWNMSRIRSQNTSPEVIVRKELTKLGYVYRLHRKSLPGQPDIVVPRTKTAIFVNGCFWHQHKNCKRRSIPKSNTGYWQKKLTQNVKKQTEDIKRLTKIGWKAIIVWECETKENLEMLKKIKRVL